MKKILHFIISLTIVGSLGGIATVTAFPQSANASCNTRFLGIPAWYDGLTNDSCDIVSPSEAGGLSTFIWHIALNIVQMALFVAGYICVAFIIYGGFLFLIGNGQPETVAKARKSIIDACIGLVISMASVAIVAFIASYL